MPVMQFINNGVFNMHGCDHVQVLFAWVLFECGYVCDMLVYNPGMLLVQCHKLLHIVLI